MKIGDVFQRDGAQWMRHKEGLKAVDDQYQKVNGMLTELLSTVIENTKGFISSMIDIAKSVPKYIGNLLRYQNERVFNELKKIWVSLRKILFE